MPNGYLCFILHAHLPYIRHPEFPEFIEERWLYEAVRECYLPLLRVLRARRERPSASRLTVSLSPTLMAMLDDPLLRQRCERHLERLVKLADRQVERTTNDPHSPWLPMARFYQVLSAENLATWRGLGEGGLVDALVDLEQRGHIELITTCATHAFSPSWKRHREVPRRQIMVGARAFERRIGHPPAGMWLP